IDTSKCDHDPLTTGDALNASCSLCVSTVCEQDSACCTKTWDASCVDRAEIACRYPASEQQAFRWREGSFYGDLFGANNLAPGKPEVRVNADPPYAVQSMDPITGTWISDGGQLSNDFIGVVYPQMYACASDNWRHDIAYMAYRVCAGPDPRTGLYTRNCAAQYVDRCRHQCGTLDAPPRVGDRDAADCSAFGTSWQWPMTTFLTGPCEAVANAAACTTFEQWPIGG
ncbi:MAG TPA: hypothetical protein VIV11_32390, partial [Kofleriaceae bacterium]